MQDLLHHGVVRGQSRIIRIAVIIQHQGVIKIILVPVNGQRKLGMKRSGWKRLCCVSLYRTVSPGKYDGALLAEILPLVIMEIPGVYPDLDIVPKFEQVIEIEKPGLVEQIPASR